ncbi:MAG: hypothetical protein U0Q07_05605 [Acidimicrobiales bacterium]
MGRAPTTGQLADRLLDETIAVLDELIPRHLPGLRIPGTFAGHRVEPDVDADLVFTLGHLADAGVTEVAGFGLDEAIATVLRRIDGPGTHTFFSYRVAETLRRFGRFDDNALLDGWSDEQRANVATACDSSEWIELLDTGILPRNYAAVLSRCELARLDLGLLDDGQVLDDLVERLRALLATNPRHFLDDSNGHVGRYDIYTADVWLFTEPLADRLGPLWAEGMAAALRLVDTVCAPDGSAITWGRSTGALSLALTIELAAVALDRRTDAPNRWLARADAARSTLAGWFHDGVVTAHQHRSPDDYRGPFRRLQLTLDLLGKLAWSAAALRRMDAAEVAEVADPTSTSPTSSTPASVPVPVPIEPAAHDDAADATPAVEDAVVFFEDERPVGVWAVHGPGPSFVLPLVGATRSDYLPGPRRPGWFEVPADADLPCFTPLVVHAGARFAGAGAPVRATHAPGRLHAEWDGLARSGELDPAADRRPLAGHLAVDWTVDRRSLVVDVDLHLDEVPQAMAMVVPEAAGRPLSVEWVIGDGTRAVADTIDVDGLKEWRSQWGMLPTVHQLDVDPATSARWSARITPTLRVASSAHGHHYDRSLYGPLGSRVRHLRSPVGTFADRNVHLDEVDVFHLHWPEWLAFQGLDEHEAIIATLADHDIPIVWTAHNLTGHDKQRDLHGPAYERWAAAADAIIHHSHWGAARFRARYPQAGGARHVVIPHGHFGDLYAPLVAGRSRTELEDELDLAPSRCRIGLVGAPREEKRVLAFLEGLAASGADVQVACWSLREDEVALVPDDPRIVVAEAYVEVDATTYARRLATCDLLALPFDPDGEMLGTGTAADVVGMGLGALVSDWGYLTEVLGDAGIPCGHEAGPIAAALDALTDDQVVAARAASVALAPAVAWGPLAERTLALFDDVALTAGR